LREENRGAAQTGKFWVDTWIDGKGLGAGEAGGGSPGCGRQELRRVKDPLSCGRRNAKKRDSLNQNEWAWSRTGPTMGGLDHHWRCRPATRYRSTASSDHGMSRGRREEGELKNPRFCSMSYEASATRHGSGVALDEGERGLEVVR